MLTVKALKDLLAGWPDDTPVVMSSDAEGNDFSPAAGVSDGIYVAECTWAGDFYDKEDFEEGSDGQVALCIWPTN